MFRFLKIVRNKSIFDTYNGKVRRITRRTFLSPAYYCNEVWDNRLSNPLLQKVNLDELYHELEQRFQKTRQISAVDVDVFSNAVTDDLFTDELVDLIHKLRLSSDTNNTLSSTPHALVRTLHKWEKYEELVNILDDRLNYGVFLDDYTANIILDTFWKKKLFALGAKVSGQLMLQEEPISELTNKLCLLHCNNFLLKPENWKDPPKPEEPEEEIKVRVKFLRNPYDDEHFDLRDPHKIIGKTLLFLLKNKDDSLGMSFRVVGSILYPKVDKLEALLKECSSKNISLIKEVLDLIPEDNEMKAKLSNFKTVSEDVQTKLINEVKKAESAQSEQDIARQCNEFTKWEKERLDAIEAQKTRLLTEKRLQNIDELKQTLKDKETKLWFFDNEENIELGIEAKKVYYPKRWFGKKKKPRKIDEGYVPPEIGVKHT